MSYTGRLAPSPTGYLHLGHAATFLAAGDRARTAGGRLLLRMDDLDPQRSKANYAEAAKEDLLWLGLRWDEQFQQSERLPLYRAAMERLLERGLAYPCTCTRKDLQQATQAPHEDGDDEPIYGGQCRQRLGLVQKTAMDGRNAIQGSSGAPDAVLRPNTSYRFRTPEHTKVPFLDRNFGPQCFTAGVDFGDFLVWRKDGLPSYQLASVVDDVAMQVTEVVRGRDLLKSTARQILLQHALDLQAPAYFHTELLRDGEGQRLAKRHDALSLSALRAAGVTPAEIRARVEALMHHSKL